MGSKYIKSALAREYCGGAVLLNLRIYAPNLG